MRSKSPSRRPRLRRVRRLIYAAAALLAFGLTGVWVVCHATAGESESRPAVIGNRPDSVSATTVRILTLNVAHGRGGARHQALARRASIVKNLDAIGRLLERESPHLVALQEADGPSSWSGDFDHVSYLAEKGAVAFHSRASSVDGLGISYGTALLATAKLEDVLAVTFDPSPPTPSKGFLAATLTIEDAGGRKREIDFVSVHLDYSRTSVRWAQVEDLVGHISSRDRPDRAVVIMGDFNCDWAEGSPLRELAGRLDLRTCDPEAPLVTFPRIGSRIDWILVSRELRILSLEILPDSVSDHRAVIAELAFE